MHVRADPNEREKLFPPLSALYTLDKRVEGAVIVVSLGITVNQSALTMEQLRATRQTTLLNMGRQQRARLETYVLKCGPAMDAAARLELEAADGAVAAVRARQQVPCPCPACCAACALSLRIVPSRMTLTAIVWVRCGVMRSVCFVL